MKKASAILTIVSLIIIAASGVFYLRSTKVSAQSQPIGYVDSDRIVQEYAPARDANSSWDDYQQQQDEVLRQKIVEKYKTDDVASLPKEAQLEVQKMFDDEDARRKQQFDKIRADKWDPAKKKIQDAINQVAQAKGIVVVLEKKAVLAGGVELTDEVLANLNK